MIEESQLAGGGGAQLAAYKYQSRGVEPCATPNKLVVKLGHQQEIIGFQAQRINNAAPLPPEEKKKTLKKKERQIASKGTLSCQPQITLPKVRLALFLKTQLG